MRSPSIGLLLSLALAATSAPASADVDRAMRNYRAVASGATQLAQLTPEEIRELIEFDRQLRGEEPDTRTPRQRCLDDEIARLGTEPTVLALRTIDLKCSQR